MNRKFNEQRLYIHRCTHNVSLQSCLVNLMHPWFLFKKNILNSSVVDFGKCVMYHYYYHYCVILSGKLAAYIQNNKKDGIPLSTIDAMWLPAPVQRGSAVNATVLLTQLRLFISPQDCDKLHWKLADCNWKNVFAQCCSQDTHPSWARTSLLCSYGGLFAHSGCSTLISRLKVEGAFLRRNKQQS